MLKGAWVRWEQRGEKGKTWGLGTRKNALARGVGGACEGCPPLSCVGSGLEGKTALCTYQRAPLCNGARTALVSQVIVKIR